MWRRSQSAPLPKRASGDPEAATDEGDQLLLWAARRGTLPRGSRRIAHLEEYERLFDDAYEVRGEASPCYTLYPRRKGAPERIKALIRDAKLGLLVRDPVARAVSQYRFSVSVENEHRSLREALSDLSDPYSLYTCPGFYAAQLERYLPHFPQENILVVDQADLHAERQATLRERSSVSLV